MSQHVFSFGDGAAEGDPARPDWLGGKGAGLAQMTLLGVPVPPGFTLSSAVSLEFLKTGAIAPSTRSAVEEALVRLEKTTGLRLGDPAAPLLVSVRSGARASMPGMMDTILNVGLTDAVAAGIAQRGGGSRFAFDAYRRFVAMHGRVALGLSAEPFAAALDLARARVAAATGADVTRWNGEELKRRVPDSALPAGELERLVHVYKALVLDATGRDFPGDPHVQLWQAVEAVFRSWRSPRAVAYRRMHRIPDAWGTACTIQAMVFGNFDASSASGVAFTRDPSTGEPRLSGEWLPLSQGDDVVSGTRTPFPLTSSGRPAGDPSLEATMPDAYRALEGIAKKLEQHLGDAQDLEFTLQSGRLYLLQCRAARGTARASVRVAVDLVREGRITKEEALLRVDASTVGGLLSPTLDPSAPKRLIARGIPASPGAASGQLVFDADEALQRSARGVAVVLVRVETSPEDVEGMKSARAIVTVRGGMTSHAAVVARGMGKPCVVASSALAVHRESQTITATVYDDHDRPAGTISLKKGDSVTVDGATGCLYAGDVATVSTALSSDFGELLAWADGVRRLRVRASADTPLDARTARSFGAEGIGLCRTEHMFFEEGCLEAMREMILADDSRGRQTALDRVLPSQQAEFAGIFREMSGLPVTIRLLDLPLSEFLPGDPREIASLSRALGVPEKKLAQRTRALLESDPALRRGGCRIALSHPEIYATQARAIFAAARDVAREGLAARVQILIPRAMSRAELEHARALVTLAGKDALEAEAGSHPAFSFGALIELPRAALLGAELADAAEFFSFGTDGLTEATLGLSREDAATCSPLYVENGIWPGDPFVSIDEPGVGGLVELAVTRGRRARPTLEVGVCGEHGSDPDSILFFHRAGLDYVSCKPFRVPAARLAAAQAALRARRTGDRNDPTDRSIG